MAILTALSRENVGVRNVRMVKGNDGEHFFLEPEQRLEKFCPPGWRSHNRHILNARILFTLYLRVKYYPVTLDFVKTEQTLHHIYLQLRRDILDERLQCQRSAACQLAAIALQAEYGDKRDTMEYFMLSHYMPDRHMLSEIGNDDMLRREISDLWVKYAGVTIREAEMEYVKLCQTLREYGIHFHRLYRNKPSSLLTPSPLGDPDTGTQLWIGIMPRGVIVFEEQDGNRVPISQHPWHTTDTLQFDHKKFVICPHSDGSLEPPKFIYYTDDYKKSMYFVNFAAGQHRFCMKMRTWAATLPMDQSSLSRRKENGTKREPNDRKKESVPSNSTDFVPIDNSEKELPVPKMRHRERGVDTQVNNQTKPMNGLLKSNSARKMSPSMSIAQPVADMSIVSPTNNASEFLNHDESISVSLNQRLEEATQSPVGANSSSDYETFNITLFKDPHFGLGLTLVDGEIEKIEGIYVRSITPGGPAHLEGRLRVADRVTSINGVSLEGKSRHDAVDLVRQSASQVHMGILRLRFVYSSSESIEQSQQHPNDNNINKNSNNDALDAGDLDNKKRRFEKSPNISNNRKRLDQLSPPSKSPPISSVDLLNNKGSNGVITNNQPAQNSMVWLNDTSTGGGVSFYSRTLSALDESSRMYSGLGGEESDDSVVSDDNDNEIATKKNKNETSSNNDNRKPTPVMRKYVRASKSSLGVNNNDQRRQVKSKMENELLDRSSTSSGSNLDLRQQQKNSNKSRSLSNLIIDQEKLPKSNNKDWTEDVALSKYYSQSNGFNLICISLPKNENGSLGIQVAGGKGQKKVYVKALVAEPALSCKQIQTGDQLASVNEISTRNMNHHEVVELLRNAESPVHLGLLRQKDIKTREVKEEHSAETIDVMLEKPTSGSLGLSLARPPNSEGIYIRVISAGSVAATDGRLKVGDRLWMINGDSVASCSPAEVVEKLKAAQGFVKLVLKREAKDSFVNSADLRA
uniref:Uncharacterized protein n=1 Tax=Romanomermis culicivorax TaxID=13658 RepID=A0A915KN57_ROMCU